MSDKLAGGRGSPIVGVIDATDRLAKDVGPWPALLLLIAVMLFFPRYGLVISLAKLWKEDRADSRKRHVDVARLAGKYHNRSDVKSITKVDQKPKIGRKR